MRATKRAAPQRPSVRWCVCASVCVRARSLACVRVCAFQTVCARNARCRLSERRHRIGNAQGALHALRPPSTCGGSRGALRGRRAHNAPVRPPIHEEQQQQNERHADPQHDAVARGPPPDAGQQRVRHANGRQDVQHARLDVLEGVALAAQRALDRGRGAGNIAKHRCRAHERRTLPLHGAQSAQARSCGRPRGRPLEQRLSLVRPSPSGVADGHYPADGVSQPPLLLAELLEPVGPHCAKPG
mmetsp:Transcript_593/g.2412  ORF Transcript_593/g.2412 Transcript_593/m.2412 type:complete len:243 (+) Transcript_593:1106-1834(+)